MRHDLRGTRRREAPVAADPRAVQVRSHRIDIHAQESRLAELAETFGVSQPTVSRAISAMTPLLGNALADYVPTAEDLDENSPYIVDGSLLPCWSLASRPELY